jgi:hypothetical protein
MWWNGISLVKSGDHAQILPFQSRWKSFLHVEDIRDRLPWHRHCQVLATPRRSPLISRFPPASPSHHMGLESHSESLETRFHMLILQHTRSPCYHCGFNLIQTSCFSSQYRRSSCNTDEEVHAATAGSILFLPHVAILTLTCHWKTILMGFWRVFCLTETPTN